MTVVHSARLVQESGVEPDAWVRFEGDTVAARGTGATWRECAGPSDEIVDASGLTLAPGFVDIHGHGGGGASFDGSDDDIRTALATHRAHGTTRSVLSLVTASSADHAERLARIARIAREDLRVIGSHLEGPFLDAGHKGAHDPLLIADATPAAVDALLSAAEGSLVQVTIAPEKPGALEAVRRFVDAGVRVAVGHTAADFDQALAAFDAGASILTHAFNAMDGIHHRAPGPVVAALARDHVTLEIIEDGVHVHSGVVKMAFDAAPGRIALITDAMGAAGAPDGAYMLGTLAVTVADGIARLTDGGAIAGSTLTLDRALRQTVEVAGVSLREAVAALTTVPARAIGRADAFGALEPGFLADAVLLDDAFDVVGVWAAGERVARA